MLFRRSLMFGNLNAIPRGYISIPYIEQTGSQWLDTEFIPNQDTKVQLKVMNLQVTGDVIFGYYTSTDLTDWRLFNYSSKIYFDIPGGSGYGNRLIDNTVNSFPINTIKELELGNFYITDLTTNTVLINGTTIANYTGTSSLKLGRYMNTSTSKNKWYYIKIYDGEVLARNMQPCIKISTNEPGLYDLVQGKFYGSETETFFVAGSEEE